MQEKAKTILLIAATGGIIGVMAAAAGFLGRGVWDAQRPHGSAAVEVSSKPERKILYYWDPMLGPSSKSDKPGISAMGMQLEPVYDDGASDGSTVKVDPATVQNMGIQTATASKGTLQKTLRTVGYLEVPETGLCDITLKVNGYIDRLYADKTGMSVKKGDPLFDLYSPDLVVAEEELIAARKSVATLQNASPEVKQQSEQLLASARRKLQLWDIPDEQITAIAALDEAPKDFTFRSPAEGQLQDKAIVQGSSVQAGMKLMRIQDQRTLWLSAQVYEGQLPLVELGAAAQASFEGLPGKNFSGEIAFINPSLNADTRTANVRIVLQNPSLALKPGMYATVQLQTKPADETVMVPAAAVIDTGTQKLVFVQESDGHFSPRTVITGLSGNNTTQVLSGLSEGDSVVTSGQFLLDVESRTQEAMQKMQGPALAAATAPAPAPATQSVDMATTGETDDLVKAYLALAVYLQQDHTDNKAADVADLVHTSGLLADQAKASENRPLAAAVKQAAAAMAGEPLDTQHKSFEKVGSAMVELLKKNPPSSKVANTLYVLNCTMEKASWLQASATITNPFLPAMRNCGEVTEKWNLKPAE